MTDCRSVLFRRFIASLVSLSILIAPLAHAQSGQYGIGSDAGRQDRDTSARSDSSYSGLRTDNGLSTTGPAPIRQWSSTPSETGGTTARASNQQQGQAQSPSRAQPALSNQLDARQPMAPPNDFQRFVFESTGESLPLYGGSLFSQGANGYVPLANTPVSPDYTLGPGDEILIRGWGGVDIDVKALIDRNGLIHMPRIGAVSLGGVKSSQAEGVIHAAVSRYYRDVQLSVTLGQLRGITIYVVGQARRPGAYTLSSTSTLISALFASGGPGPNGSLRRVQVKRADHVVAELDLYAFLTKGDKSADIKLQDGDAIVMPVARGFVALTGKVNTPAIYELMGPNDSIDSILAVAGGLPVVADPKKAYLERVDPARKPSRTVDSFPLDAAGLKRTLRSGDLLTVKALTSEFGNAVTLRGNVEQPVRMPWRPGMTVRDLIPSKAVLMSQASLKRQNEVLMTDVQRRKVQMADELLEPELDQDQDAGSGMPQSSSSSRKLATTRTDKTDGATSPVTPRTPDFKTPYTPFNDTLAQRIGNLVDEVNLDYAVIERVDSGDVSVKLLPFNLRLALENSSSPENLSLQAGDIVTVFSVNDMRVPQAKRRVIVRVEGEVQRPGIYQVSPGENMSKLIELAGGLTPDAYLFGAGFYREEVRKAQAQNLQQLVRRLEAQSQTRLSSAVASNSGGDAAASAQVRMQAEAEAQERALDRLRNLRPTGRIMLGLQPEESTVERLPQLKLENRDRLVVPSRPDFVYVLGSVNTESSLIWRPGRSVQHYLDVSGLTSGADKDELFIIRADGSVLSGSDRWFNRITSTVVQPGDLIVLPEKADHESGWSVFTRNAKDITQIIYQFSLGAAAIKTLRSSN